MSHHFTLEFKQQAVKKALSRSEKTTLADTAKSLNVANSTLNRWIRDAKKHRLESQDPISSSTMKTEKSPHNWSMEERLEVVIACASLNEERISELCRSRGVFTHHVTQWKQDFIHGTSVTEKTVKPTETKALQDEIKSLKKDLNRKNKALAEAAALIVLKKKAHDLWGTDEDNLP